MTSHETLLTLFEHRASAILRTDDQDTARSAMDAAVRGGFRVIEFTLTVPGVFDLIREFSSRDDDLIVGAGTVLTPEDARRAVEAGARFLVSPVTDPAVISAARGLGVPAMPGTHTATEMWQAHQAGASLQKLFPAPAGGPAYVRSILGPLPFLRIVPTNGVDAENAADWLAAGVFGMGFVASLFTADDLRAARWERVEERAREILEVVGKAKRPERDWNFDPPTI